MLTIHEILFLFGITESMLLIGLVILTLAIDFAIHLSFQKQFQIIHSMRDDIDF